MKKEKIIKQQARQALKGNFVVLLSGFLAVAVIAVLLENLFYLIALPLDLIDLETEKFISGKEQWGSLLVTAIVVIAGLASPLFNGLLKAAGNAAVTRRCEITDLLYFYRKPKRFFRTVFVNMGLCSIFAVLSLPFTICGRLFFSEGWIAVVWTVISVIWRVLVYMIFMHYPLAAYALDENRSLVRYLFGYIGFSFRRFGALFTLLLSMSGWLALCFLVVPAIYVGPYLAVVLMNSARWLFDIK